MIKGGMDTTIKFLIYLLVFLILVLIFVFLFIIPQIKTYKKVKSEYNYNVKHNLIYKEQQKDFNTKLSQLEKDNKKVIDIFSKKFDIEKFKSYSTNYFHNIKIVPLENDINSSALKIYKFNATLKSKNPREFYNFIKDLSKYDGLIKINFPITISSEKSLLNIFFHMSIYSMNSK